MAVLLSSSPELATPTNGLESPYTLPTAADEGGRTATSSSTPGGTTSCLTPDRAIDLGQLERLVKRNEDARQRLLFEVAAELYGHEQGVSLSELFAELDGEDLDRVLEAIAVGKRRGARSRGRRTISGYAPPSQASRNMTAEV